nr:glucose-1-phosphatase [Helicoverpa armigera]
MYLKALVLLLLALKSYCEQNFTLEQVLILSRHNVRTPLSKNLADFTPKHWPVWKEKSGYLTAKGALLEGYMGEYFALWLNKQGLLQEKCPKEDIFYVYANTAQRTLASAKAFVNKGFPGCEVKIHHTSEPKDPIFNPVVHNTSALFKLEAIEQMKMLLKSLHLNGSYVDLEEILNYKQSEYCLTEHKCNLLTDTNKIFVNVGVKPNLEGPLKISKSVIDSFIMENYEGFPKNEVAWGQLKNKEEWNLVLDLSKGYHSVIFNTTLIARDLAKPLLTYMRDLILDKKYIISFLMGHDANIYTVLKSLDFKPYSLKGQYEMTPAGGKLVFQKWKDQNSDFDFLKVEYVYQCTNQMREGRRLSIDNPPEFTSLQLEGCKTDDSGFCLWDDFVALLCSLVD